MKKKLFVAMIVTFLTVMMFSASALALSITGPETVEQGQTITLTIDGGSVEGVTGNIRVSGLELVSYSGGLSDPETILLIAELGGMTGTYTYRVTADVGQTASFTVSDVMESVNDVDQPAPGAGWQAVVGGAPAQSTPPSQTPTPSETAAPSDARETQTPAPSESTEQPTQGQQQTAAPTPAPSGGTPVAGGTTSDNNNNNAAGGTTTGGTTTGGSSLPKTADSTTNMWLFAILTAVIGTIAIIAAKKCSIRGEAHDEQ